MTCLGAPGTPRNEDSGEMHGLIRVRQFTISEGHIVLRPDQLEEEFRDSWSWLRRNVWRPWAWARM